jgi:hypothetical protein
MLIPVFGSCPTYLNESQEGARRFIYGELGRQGFEVRTIGRTDYPVRTPLLEVFVLARHCSGGLVLGFSQFETDHAISKRGTPYEKEQNGTLRIATPWNQLEAGILFSLGIPLLVFREEGVAGGVFDAGTTEIFVHEMPKPNPSAAARRALREIVQKWGADVRTRYYKNPP